ncbi:MAG: discoidin domain-containing protein [Phycisphaerales bacterium]|nr:MAG: discoidin domain-containing protein [Phycisphaerales bacterium]
MNMSKMTVPLAAAVFVLALGCGAQAALPDGLVAYYKLDATSGLTAPDETGAHDGTLTGALAWVEGKDGNGLQFRGGNGSPFVDLGAWQTDGPTGLGLAVWAKWAGLSGAYQGLIRQREGTMYWWTELNPEGTQLRFKSNTSPQSNLTITGEHLIEGEWTHFACSHDAAAGTGAVYLNGQEQLTGSWSLPAGDFSGLRSGIGVVNTADGLGTFNGVLDEVMIFNVPLTPEMIASAMQGFSDPTASTPVPANGADDSPRDVVLGWRPGATAIAHDVYFGTAFDDVSVAGRANPLGLLVSQGQDANAYDPDGLLEFGQRYYWRVDEVNEGPGAEIFKGEVWSFTAEPFAYPIDGVMATANAVSDSGAGIENTVNGSGLNESDQHSTDPADMWLASASGDEPVWVQYEFDRVYQLHEMWVWNYNVQFELVLGFGLKDVSIEYSVDGAEWTALGDAQLAQGTATPDYEANSVVDLQDVAARFVRITVNSKWGGMPQYGLSEVRFYQIPAFARDPQPASGAVDVSVNAGVSWRAGRGATSHEIYFSTDEAAVVDGTAPADTVTESSYAPSGLNFGRQYYWKVDEITDGGTWEGDLWSFATEEYALVDDFESYDDDDNPIFETWIDGWVNETGSMVGYLEAPFAEQTIVHGGGQSMPLSYENTAAPFYSEAEYDLGVQNWARNGADTLRLFVQGKTPAFAESSDGTLLMSAIGTDIWGTADQFRYAYKSLSGDGAIVVRVDAVGNSNAWAKAGVMIRETLDVSSPHAMVVVTPTSGVSFQRRPEAGVASAHTTQADLAAPYWVKLARSGNTFTAERSEDGITWVSITDDAAASTAEIPMGAGVFIGLALTSHDANIETGAQFADVATTGSVAGQWQTADIGITQPTGGNDMEPLYVALEDTAGNVAVVTHPNEAATALTGWSEWLISLSDFSGVNLSSVKMVYIGVGDRDNPAAGGTGLIYIDDIGVGHPADVE